MRIVALDPGKLTGVASWRDGEHAAVTVTYDEGLDCAERCVAGGVDLVICEDFIISERTVRSGTSGWRRGMELEFIGVVRRACRHAGTDFRLQPPAEAHGFSTDAKLRAMGMWTPGPDHARDASRHLLLALVALRLVTPAELAEAMR